MEESYIFYRSFFEAIEHMPDDDAGKLIKVLSAYALNGEQREIGYPCNMVFDLIKPQIDANLRKRANGRKGAEHGIKGGRPKKNDAKTEAKIEPETCVSEVVETVVNEIKNDANQGLLSETPVGLLDETPEKPQKNPKNTIENPTETPTKPPMVNGKWEMVNGKGEIEGGCRGEIAPLLPPSSASPKKSKTAKKPKPIKHKYGEYGHVMLTDAELEKLRVDYGHDRTDEAIKFLDEGIEEKGYKYKSHNLAMRRWVFNALDERDQKAKKANRGPNSFHNFTERPYTAEYYDNLEQALLGRQRR